MKFFTKLKCLIFGHNWKNLNLPPMYLAYKCQRCSKEKEWDFSTRPLANNPLLRYETDEDYYAEIKAALDIAEDTAQSYD